MLHICGACHWFWNGHIWHVFAASWGPEHYSEYSLNHCFHCEVLYATGYKLTNKGGPKVERQGLHPSPPQVLASWVAFCQVALNIDWLHFLIKKRKVFTVLVWRGALTRSLQHYHSPDVVFWLFSPLPPGEAVLWQTWHIPLDSDAIWQKINASPPVWYGDKTVIILMLYLCGPHSHPIIVVTDVLHWYHCRGSIFLKEGTCIVSKIDFFVGTKQPVIVYLSISVYRGLSVKYLE